MNKFEQIFNDWMTGGNLENIATELLEHVPQTNELAGDCYLKLEGGVTFYIRANTNSAVVAFNIDQLLQSDAMVYKLRHILNNYNLSKKDMSASAMLYLNEGIFSNIVDHICQSAFDKIHHLKLQGVQNIKPIFDESILVAVRPEDVEASGYWLCRRYGGIKFHYVKTLAFSTLQDTMDSIFKSNINFHLTGFCLIPFVLVKDGLLIDLYQPEHVYVNEKGPVYALDDQSKSFGTAFSKYIHNTLLDMIVHDNLNNVVSDIARIGSEHLFVNTTEVFDRYNFDRSGKNMFNLLLTVDNKDGKIKRIKSLYKSKYGIGCNSKSKCSHNRTKYSLVLDADIKTNTIIFSLQQF